MDKNTLFGKTAAGREAMTSRPAGLVPRLRSLLIMVDGKRNLAEFEKLTGSLEQATQSLNELMAAGDRREHVGRHLAGADFTPKSLGPRTAGAYFLNRVLRGEAVDWATCDVPPCEVDRVLAALGLYHVRVCCVIPEELGGHYEHEVSAVDR